MNNELFDKILESFVDTQLFAAKLGELKEPCERCEGAGQVRFVSYAPIEGEAEYDWGDCPECTKEKK